MNLDLGDFSFGQGNFSEGTELAFSYQSNHYGGWRSAVGATYAVPPDIPGRSIPTINQSEWGWRDVGARSVEGANAIFNTGGSGSAMVQAVQWPGEALTGD